MRNEIVPKSIIIFLVVKQNKCKKLNSLKHLVRTTVAG